MNTFHKLARVCAAVAFCVTPMVANAGTISINTGTISGPDRFENFDLGTSIAGVTNEFSSNGLTMTTLSGNGIALVQTSTCNNSISGVSGGYLYMGIVPNCSLSNAIDAVSIKFDTDVSELSWKGFNVASRGGFAIEALLDGVVVSSTLFNASNTFHNGSVLFSGSIFDEITFTEDAGGSLFFGIDDMAWNIAAVPLPAGLPLLAGGLAAFGLMGWRRRGIS